MKILQVSTLVDRSFGGAETTLLEFRHQLQASGIDVTPAGLQERGTQRLDGSTALTTPIPNIYWPYDGVRHTPMAKAMWHLLDLRNPMANLALSRLVQQVAPDAMLVHNVAGWSLEVFRVAKKFGLPVVQVVHDYGLLCVSRSLWHGCRPCGRLDAPCRVRRKASRALCRPDAVVGVSRFVLEQHRTYRLFEDVPEHLIEPPVSIAPKSGERAEPARLLGDRPTFGYVGRVTVDKGPHLLLDAAQTCGARVVLGGPIDSEYARSLRATYGQDVEWLGWCEPEEVFSRVDALVVPSLWPEPFGRVAKEAAIYGLPVIVSSAGGLPEAISNARNYVEVVDLSRPNALVHALTRFGAIRGRSDQKSIVDVIRGISR